MEAAGEELVSAVDHRLLRLVHQDVCIMYVYVCIMCASFKEAALKSIHNNILSA